jgi:predicted amidohydrolase YtcJ
MLADAVAKRERLAWHVVGDSAVAIVVRLMDAVAPDSVWRTLRVRFEHGGIMRARDLWTSAAAKGVVVVGNLQLTPPEVVRTLPKAVVESMTADFSADDLSLFPIGLGSDGVSRSPL